MSFDLNKFPKLASVIKKAQVSKWLGYPGRDIGGEVQDKIVGAAKGVYNNTSKAISDFGRDVGDGYVGSAIDKHPFVAGGAAVAGGLGLYGLYRLLRGKDKEKTAAAFGGSDMLNTASKPVIEIPKEAPSLAEKGMGWASKNKDTLVGAGGGAAAVLGGLLVYNLMKKKQPKTAQQMGFGGPAVIAPHNVSAEFAPESSKAAPAFKQAPADVSPAFAPKGPKGKGILGAVLGKIISAAKGVGRAGAATGAAAGRAAVKPLPLTVLGGGAAGAGLAGVGYAAGKAKGTTEGAKAVTDNAKNIGMGVGAAGLGAAGLYGMYRLLRGNKKEQEPQAVPA